MGRRHIKMESTFAEATAREQSFRVSAAISWRMVCLNIWGRCGGSDRDGQRGALRRRVAKGRGESVHAGIIAQ